MTTSIDRMREAGKIALEASDRLYAISAHLVEPEHPNNGALRAAHYVQESAAEIRRHALWLTAEADSLDAKR